MNISNAPVQASFITQMSDPHMSEVNAMKMKIRQAQETEKLGKTMGPKEKQIEASAQEFEAVFVTEMLKPMFEGVKTDETFGGGKGEDVFKGLMMEQYGKLIAQRGGLGIADAVKSELIRIQEQKGQK